MKAFSVSYSNEKRRQTVGLLYVFLISTIFLFIAFPSIAFSQEEIEEEIADEEEIEKHIISIGGLASLMWENEEVIILNNLEIIATEDDKDFMVDNVLDTIYVIQPKSSKIKKVHFFDCDFNIGDKELVFIGWHFNKLDLLGCNIYNGISFENIAIEGNFPINIDNCKVRNTLQFRNNEHGIERMKIINSVFEKNLVIDNDIQYLVIEECLFNPDLLTYEKEDEEKTLFQLMLNNINIGTIEINDCDFTSNGISNLFSVDFRDSQIENLSMFNNNLHSIDLSWSTVEKSLLIDSLIVETYIGILNFDFPDNNTNIPWYNFSGEKLALLYNEEDEELLTTYQAKTSEQLTNTLDYNDLISSYTKFNTLYHDRGDIHSANKSYVEIKTIETRRQKYLLESNWDFNIYINYQLNVFLSFFSDFATNPGKSLIQSLWVLLIFTILYMISFSKWDDMNYTYFLKQYSDFSEYIKTNKSIDDVYGNDLEQNLEHVEKVEDDYINSGKAVPRILKLIGIPLYQMGKFRYKIVPGLIRLFNFQDEEWKKVKGVRRLIISLMIFLISILFLIYVLIVKFIASFALSLNSFVLIGFGQPPEKGLAMYLSIIEGIIGWFLLTIFTITLLSQVLQSA